MAEVQNRSLARGLDILELLCEQPEGLELHRIARALEIPKSSAFNLVHTLLSKKYVVCDEATGRYALSLRMFEVGSAAVKGVTEQSVVRRYMERVAAGCNETVHCGVPDGTDVVYVDKLESTHSIRMTSRIGARVPLYCTAMGRAVLACWPEEHVRELYRNYDFRKLTPRTVDSVEALLDEVGRVRGQGYAAEYGESNENVCCFAVAVRDRSGRAAYAISVSMPLFRASEETAQRCVRLLLDARGRIERFLHAM